MWHWVSGVLADFHSWRRGETRIAPRGLRGRVYARKQDQTDGLSTKATGDVKISARIKRAGKKDWEDLGEVK